jgi:hypothetical protein
MVEEVVKMLRLRSALVGVVALRLACSTPCGWAQEVGNGLSDGQRQLITTLVEGLKDHHARCQRISGRMVVSSYYSDLAIRLAAAAVKPEYLIADRIETPRWSHRGVEFYDFTLSDEKWAVRGARLHNNGFGECGLPGKRQIDEGWSPAPWYGWNPPAMCDYSDGNLRFEYTPHNQRADLRPLQEEHRMQSLATKVLNHLLEARGGPPHYWIERALAAGRPMEVEPLSGQPGAPEQVYRVAYRTGEERGCRMTWWIGVRGSDCAVIKYEDYALKEDRTGYRVVAEATQAVEVGEGLFLASGVVTSRYLYLLNEATAWKWTTVMTLLDIREHDGEEPAFTSPWEWLPLGVLCHDNAFLMPGSDLENPMYDVGDIRSALWYAQNRHPRQPPFTEAWDRPIDDAAWNAHGMPAPDRAVLPPIKPAPRKAPEGAQAGRPGAP